MADASWTTPAALSASLVDDELDSLADGSETAQFTFDNSSNLDLYGAVTVKLGSLAPSSGGSITLRVVCSDGTNVADKSAGDQYTAKLLSGASAKVVIFPMVRLYPFSLRFSIVNNSGATLNAADNDVYIRTYNEQSS